jgi:hypothetical protein
MMRLLATAGILAALTLPAFASAGTTAACGTRGLTFSTVRVVALSVRGLRCSAARAVAVKVVHELGHGQPVSVTGEEGVSTSQSTCTGCKTTTSVSIQYPHGRLTISLLGGSGTSSATVPAPPSFQWSGSTAVI